jgi:hypothetical protein
MRPFGLCDGAFDNNMVDLFVIVSSLPLGVKIGVGSSGDHEDCVVGGESVVCGGGSRACGGGGFISGLFCWLVLLDVG